ncbi:tail fiber protein [Flavobacterium restrictum]|uniref:DUF342 domain-containing protein n=1 Tax=Flavobacterium restrictum TaxID=2594428 RepID=A0A553DTD2_9FLAO|nr:tail fiber protein [Flavobacterium restrictum]TRX35950.1 DUF342 domain-containing protein [Flavobacterium restrictum]
MKTQHSFLVLTLLFLATTFSLQAQTLNSTLNISAAGTADTFKEGYTFAYATSGTPWNGPLMSFGGLYNQYDCQISSDYGPNGGNHFSFRTRNGDTPGSWNAWNEIATRGANTFTGNQTINGNLNILGTTNKIVGFGDAANYYIGTYPVTGSSSLDLHWYGGIRFGDLTSPNVMQITNGNVGIGTATPSEKLEVVGNVKITGNQMISGNVGIGTTIPDAKLTVNGTVHATEVKVTVSVPADYVFQKYYTGTSTLKAGYTLPTLDQVAQYTQANHHLPNIPAAQDQQANGVNLGEMNNLLLQKIEELTLYAIEQQKKLEILSERLAKLEK